MAFCIYMVKEYEDKEKVIYSYGPSEAPELRGKLEYNKKTQELKILEAIKGYHNSDKRYSNRVCMKIMRYISHGDGSFPQEDWIIT